MANIDKDKILSEIAKASGGKMDMEKIKKRQKTRMFHLSFRHYPKMIKIKL